MKRPDTKVKPSSSKRPFAEMGSLPSFEKSLEQDGIDDETVGTDMTQASRCFSIMVDSANTSSSLLGSFPNRCSRSPTHSNHSRTPSPKPPKSKSLLGHPSKDLIIDRPRSPQSPVQDACELIRVRHLKETSTQDHECTESSVLLPSALKEKKSATTQSSISKENRPSVHPSPDCMTETPLLVFRLSDKFKELEGNRRNEKMTSRKLMEISKKMGIPIAYSTGRGMELISENEGEFNNFSAS
jgi:hypothetical protein